MTNFFARLVYVGLVLALAAKSVWANCWTQPEVISLACDLAQRKFPNAAGQMPSILVCADQLFPPSVGGQYNSGAHQIILPVRSIGQDMGSILAHELGHAEVALTGGSGGGATAGHGREWMRAMLLAGEGTEAQRVAGLYQAQGGYNELASAQQSLGRYPPGVLASATPPAPTYQRTCFSRPVLQIVRFANGAHVQLVVNVVTCE